MFSLWYRRGQVTLSKPLSPLWGGPRGGSADLKSNFLPQNQHRLCWELCVTERQNFMCAIQPSAGESWKVTGAALGLHQSVVFTSVSELQSKQHPKLHIPDPYSPSPDHPTSPHPAGSSPQFSLSVWTGRVKRQAAGSLLAGFASSWGPGTWADALPDCGTVFFHPKHAALPLGTV